MADSKSKTTTRPTHIGGPGRGPGHGHGLVEKPKNFWKTTRRLMSYMSDRIVGLILVLIFAITSVVFQIRTPKILGQATTEIFKGVMKGQSQQKAGFNIAHLPINYAKIIHIIIIVGLMYLASAVFSFLQQWIMTRISQQTVYLSLIHI